MTNGNGNSHTTTGREKNENGGNAAASIQKAYEIAHDPHPMSKTEAQVFGVLGLIFVSFVGCWMKQNEIFIHGRKQLRAMLLLPASELPLKITSI